ncbi:hypothetical protein SAY87_014715 [Trapa incisa]|uniref:LOB domain-containing protein n=1 Tax=Trapa incisa TaxID=236973 RepID=A0AAN7GT26_9MYRT|nr:hypothetical protein SAY87_014715 [Trapa incisa]
MMHSRFPCGACKFLKRKCVRGCIFAPYLFSVWCLQISQEKVCEGMHICALLVLRRRDCPFRSDPNIFGASKISKLLLRLPTGHRCKAIVTISYEA